MPFRGRRPIAIDLFAGAGGFSLGMEQAGFEVMITADKNIRYQQNLASRKICLIVIGNAQWPFLRDRRCAEFT